MIIDRRLVTSSALLHLAAGTGKQVGDAEAPANLAAGEPYAILHAIEGGDLSGPTFWAPEADAALVYQVDSVGYRRDQAEWMGDLVRRTMLARASGRFQVAWPTIDGWRVIDRRAAGGLPGPTPEGKAPHRLWLVQERFTVHLTPA